MMKQEGLTQMVEIKENRKMHRVVMKKTFEITVKKFKKNMLL